MKKLILIFFILTATVSAGSFTISDSLGESTFMYSFGAGAQNNYGGAVTFNFGQNVAGARYQNVLLKWPTLRDSMDAVGTATWDSAIVKIVLSAVNGLNGDDSIFSTIHKVTTLWDEGSGTGSAVGGVTWDSASATGTGGAEPNSPLDWTSNGGDYQANGEDQPTTDTTHYYAIGDTVALWNGGVSVRDTILYRISGTTVADTLGEGLEIVASRQNSSGGLTYYSDETTTTIRGPKIEVFYTTGAAADAFRGQVMGTVKID